MISEYIYDNYISKLTLKEIDFNEYEDHLERTISDDDVLDLSLQYPNNICYVKYFDFDYEDDEDVVYHDYYTYDFLFNTDCLNQNKIIPIIRQDGLYGSGIYKCNEKEVYILSGNPHYNTKKNIIYTLCVICDNRIEVLHCILEKNNIMSKKIIGYFEFDNNLNLNLFKEIGFYNNYSLEGNNLIISCSHYCYKIYHDYNHFPFHLKLPLIYK